MEVSQQILGTSLALENIACKLANQLKLNRLPGARGGEGLGALAPSEWDRRDWSEPGVAVAGPSPLPGHSLIFFPCCRAQEISLSHIWKFPLPLILKRRHRNGREGTGLLLGAVVAQSISPKLRLCLLPKRKMKVNSPQGHLSSLPVGVVKTVSMGFPRRVAWATTLSDKGTPVPWPGPLQVSALLSSPPLQANHDMWPSGA